MPDSKRVKCVEPAASKARDGGADLIGSLFSHSTLSNCTITISPQNMALTVGCTGPSSSAPAGDYSYLFDGVSLEEFES